MKLRGASLMADFAFRPPDFKHLRLVAVAVLQALADRVLSWRGSAAIGLLTMASAAQGSDLAGGRPPLTISAPASRSSPPTRRPVGVHVVAAVLPHAAGHVQRP